MDHNFHQAIADWEPTLDQQVQGVEEQIHFLSLYTFPAQVGARKMTQDRADRKLKVLRAAAQALRKARDAEPRSLTATLASRKQTAMDALGRVLGQRESRTEKRAALLEIAKEAQRMADNLKMFEAHEQRRIEAHG